VRFTASPCQGSLQRYAQAGVTDDIPVHVLGGNIVPLATPAAGSAFNTTTAARTAPLTLLAALPGPPGGPAPLRCGPACAAGAAACGRMYLDGGEELEAGTARDNFLTFTTYLVWPEPYRDPTLHPILCLYLVHRVQRAGRLGRRSSSGRAWRRAVRRGRPPKACNGSCESWLTRDRASRTADGGLRARRMATAGAWRWSGQAAAPAAATSPGPPWTASCCWA